MTIPEIVTYLKGEQAILAEAIARLENLARMQSHLPYGGRRRGRKSMGHEERQEVSRRMKAYWAQQRKRA